MQTDASVADRAAHVRSGGLLGVALAQGGTPFGAPGSRAPD